MDEIDYIRNKLKSINSTKKEDAILLINYNNLGDIICDTPSLRNLRKSYPKYKIIFLVRNQACIELMKKCPYVDKTIEMPHSRDSLDIYYEFCKKLKKYNFIFSMQFVRPFNEIKRTHIPYMLNIENRYGLIQPSYKDQYDRAFTKFFLLNNTTTRTEESLELLKLLNIKIDNEKTECWYDSKKIMHLNHKNYILVQTCATMECRMWHRSKFIELIKKILEYDSAIEILLTGTPNEDEYIEKIYNKISDKRIFKYTNLNIDTLLAYIKNARLVITNDTGPYHFARAFDTKRIVLFGISPKKYLINKKERNSIELIGTNKCPKDCSIKKINKNCDKIYKMYGDKYNCINTIEIETVFNSVIKLMEEKCYDKK